MADNNTKQEMIDILADMVINKLSVPNEPQFLYAFFSFIQKTTENPPIREQAEKRMERLLANNFAPNRLRQKALEIEPELSDIQKLFLGEE